MKTIKNNGYDRVVGFKWGMITYWKGLKRRDKRDITYNLSIHLGAMNRCLPVCLRRVYRSSRKPRFRNLPLLHLLLSPVLLSIFLYFIVLAVLELLGEYVFYHIYDELVTMPVSKKKLAYEFIWTSIAVLLVLYCFMVK